MRDSQGTARSRLLFTLFVLALAGQRLLELRHSSRNEAWMAAQGGQEHAAGQMPVMKALHTSWFLVMLAEVWGWRRPFYPALAAAGGLLLLVGQILRYSAIRTLGRRWSVRVITLPDSQPVQGGIYRLVRHPNYLGVILEILAVPLIHTATFTAGFFSLANALLLRARIRAEEQALGEANQYRRFLGDLPRFVPRFLR